jgi:signal transduction histidine kinase
MRQQFSVFIFIFFLLFNFLYIHQPSEAKGPVVLNNPQIIKMLDSSNCEALNIITNKHTHLKNRNFNNTNHEKSYWYTFSVSNPSDISIDYLLVSYNYSIDEIDLIKVNKGRNETKIFRDTTNVYQRNIVHKQPVFNIHLEPNEKATYMLRLKNESSYYFEFAFYSPEKFASSFFFEYLIFGVFYGFILYVIIYNLFYYSLFKEQVILFYCLFIVSQVISMLFRDGTGLFVLPYYSAYTEIIESIARCTMGVFLMLFTYSYFKTILPKSVYKWFIIIIILRIIYTIVMRKETTLFTFHFELFTFIFCTFWSIYSYKKENSDAKFMVIGIIILTSCYFLFYLSVVVSSSLSSVGFFGLYYGIAIESIFMTLAIGERIKRIKIEHSLTLQLNTDLEQQVKTRTELIQEKNNLLEEKSEELNLFLYSASHDFKGPLKTIEGLCNIGLYENNLNIEDNKELIKLIKKKLSNLESNIADLNTYTKIQDASTVVNEINFDTLHQAILERFVDNNNYNNSTIQFTNGIKKQFISDGFAVKAIYQNVFENALKYRDSKRDLILKITIEDLTSHIKIVFNDNGQGIPEVIQPKIFNMFYRGNVNSNNDTGLGLYIVKKALVKIGGTITVKSTENIGSTFEIILPKK